MNFDLRLPIGILFSFFGVLLAAYGLLTPAAMYRASLGLDINLWWGLALLVFGGVMLTLALRARGRGRA